MEKFTLGVLLIALYLALYSLLVGAVQFAWNAAVVPAFGGPVLSFWQTYGCMFVVSFVGACFKQVTASK